MIIRHIFFPSSLPPYLDERVEQKSNSVSSKAARTSRSGSLCLSIPSRRTRGWRAGGREGREGWREGCVR